MKEKLPTAFSSKMIVKFGVPTLASIVSKRTGGFLEDLSGSLQREGCKLIGHIKMLVDGGEQGVLFSSITSFNKKADCSGNLKGEIIEARLVINVIVYGVQIHDIERIVWINMKSYFPGACVKKYTSMGN